MVVLTEKQIEYGFDYFHKDEPQNKWVIEVSEYNGEKALTINCTQLGDSFTPEYKTAKEKNRVVQEWCDFYKKTLQHLRNWHLVQECLKSYSMLFAPKKILKNYI